MSEPYIIDQFKTLVDRVSAKVLAAIQAVDPNITAISYQHGRKVDIIGILKRNDESPNYDTKGENYPMVWLYEPFVIGESKVTGCWAQVKLNVAIFNSTSTAYSMDERYEKNFKPILGPIYNELMVQLDKSGWYHIQDSRFIKNDMARKAMWGKAANEFSYPVDAIEINNLTLDVYFDDACS